MREQFRVGIAATLLVSGALFSAHVVTPALATGAPPSIVQAAAAGWVYYATYPDYASCVAAGQGNPEHRNWQCVRSNPSGPQHDLYLWY